MAETPPTGTGLADLVRVISPFLPGFAGAVIGMSFGEGLTVRGRLLSLATGLLSVAFLWPAAVMLVEQLLNGGEALPSPLAGALAFLIGTFGMIVLSGLAQALAKYSRDPLGLVKITAGPVKIGREGGS